ncbi:hypothetical protein ScPMuIL_013209 [Solemya velum]
MSYQRGVDMPPRGSRTHFTHIDSVCANNAISNTIPQTYKVFTRVFGTVKKTLSKGHDDDDHGDFKDDMKNRGVAILGLSATYGGLLIAFIVIAGFFSLGAFLFFGCKKWISKKLGIQPAVIIERGVTPPKWTRYLTVDPSIVSCGFGAASDGITITGPNSVMRHRRGKVEGDAARWSHGFTSGKHVFEITWPKDKRGVYAQVGLGTTRAPLNCRGAASLVGMTNQSWGLDIVRRRVIHKGEVSSICPSQNGIFVPEKFLMYVDMDTGKLGFGNEDVFWGMVVSELNQPDVYPLYIMVGMTAEDSRVEVVYKGSEASPDDLPTKTEGGENPQAPPSYESLDECAPNMIPEPTKAVPDSPPPPYRG